MRTLVRKLPVLILLVLGSPVLFAQAGYFPPNPVMPPQITPPAMTQLEPLTPPSVQGPVATQTEESAPLAQTVTTVTKTVKPSSSLPATLSDAANPLSLLNALGSGDSGGQGADVLSALLGGSTGGLSGAAGIAGTNPVDQAKLQKILDLLEKQQTQKKDVAPVRVPAPVTAGAEIVRFTVNGYDVGSTTNGVVSSTLAKDGSFLLTGTRIYLSSYRSRSESFYLLCKKKTGDQYRLYADVSQDFLNEYSFVYQLAHKTPLTGTRVGDLVVFRTNDPAWNLDLVIRLFGPSVSASSGR